MVMTLTETDLKETFGVMVKAPLCLINYRAYEVSVEGIEREIEAETLAHRRKKLLKIRSQMKKILNEL